VQSGDTIAGDVRLHAAFPSAVLHNQRDIVVYLPPSYRKDKKRRFPVLYLQDGQNVFDARTSAFGVEWQLDEAAERLIGEGAIEEIIMVGVYNTEARMSEYTPPWSERPGTGGIDGYARFLLDEVKPFIDETYRTLPEAPYTGIMGSSLGGLSALYLGLRFPHVFSRIGAVSPSLWFGHAAALRWVEQMPRIEGCKRLWLCAGALESRAPNSDFSYAIEGIRQMKRILVSRGLVEGHSLFYCEDENGRHDEASWAARSPMILQALYAPAVTQALRAS
jgi:predicted alpha/beta superfamily hydrolase